MSLRPALPTVMNAWLDERLNYLHTAMPGKFKSYDRDMQTAEVIPVVKQSLLAADGSRTEIELPVIPNVRVLWPRTTAGYIHFPISPGDFCLLVFNEAAIGFWRESGEVASPGDLERHGLSHPYALPGAWPDASPLENPPAAPAIVVADHLEVAKPGGSVDFVALKSAIDALQQNLDSMCSFGTPFGPTTPGNLAPVGPQDSSNALKAGK